MGALRARKTSRSVLFIVVAGVHALAIAVLLSESRIFHLTVSRAVPIHVTLVLSVHHRHEPLTSARLHALAKPRTPITAPITLILPAVTTPLHVARPINWARAARQAVSTVLHRHQQVTIGFPGGAQARSQLHSNSSAVQPGATYRTPTGQRVHQISRHCYVESSPPPLDASRLEQQAQMAHVGCSGVFSSSDDNNLFKHLPAYKRYHKLPPRALNPPRRARRRHKRHAASRQLPPGE